MSSNVLTTPGADGDFWTDKKPIKTYNEQMEILVWKILESHKELFIPGMVRGLLVEDLMKFYENNSDRRHTR